jgi:hypothetical protein
VIDEYRNLPLCLARCRSKRKADGDEAPQMAYQLTSQQFADVMNANLSADAPGITPREVTMWTVCGLIRDFSTTKRAGFRPEDIEAFIRAYPLQGAAIRVSARRGGVVAGPG